VNNSVRRCVKREEVREEVKRDSVKKKVKKRVMKCVKRERADLLPAKAGRSVHRPPGGGRC
jgi:hypothetical protein